MLKVHRTDCYLAAVLVSSFLNKPLSIEQGQSDVSVATLDEKVIEGISEIVKILVGSDNIDKLSEDWIKKLSFSSTKLTFNQIQEIVETLQSSLTDNFLNGSSVSVSDICAFSILKQNSVWNNIVKKGGMNKTHSKVLHWFNEMSQLDFIKKGCDIIFLKSSSSESNEKKNSDKTNKKYVELEKAEMGKVVVRFPPEASGYLHIGHAKAALLNYIYAQQYKGKLIMRFDDTNPEKEEGHFEQSILEDLKSLGVQYDQISNTSDYFDQMLQFATKMISEGNAYIDNTPVDQMRSERMNGIESSNRTNSIETNLSMWKEMQNGTKQGLMCCLRAKIDMKTNNKCMRDPVMYRCNLVPHLRTKTKYKVYPTYDFACPIVDCIEGVTHVLRTNEYRDRKEQFEWFCSILKLKIPIIHDYSRLNMMYTVMSKRKLAWFVENNYVDGWDDPRFPTVRGILRRGLTVEGLKAFIMEQGASRSDNLMEWDKIWSVNKGVIDPIAPRYSAIEKDKAVKVVLSNVPIAFHYSLVDKHPKNALIGQKKLSFSNIIYIEGDDASEITLNEKVTLKDWGNIVVTKIDLSQKYIEGCLLLEDKNFKDTKKLNWVSSDYVEAVGVEFDHLISKKKVEESDKIEDILTKQTRFDTELIVESAITELKVGDIIQFIRRGYFRVDSIDDNKYIFFNIPDGRQSHMSSLSTKTISAAAHRKEPKNTIVKDQSKPLEVKKELIGMTAKKEEDFSEWYLQILKKAEIISPYPVTGCFVIRPNAFYVWERITEFLDKKFKKNGTQNCYFPMFVRSESLQKEAKNFSDFAPEVAWVTKCGNTEFNEPIGIRPTSEAVMYPSISCWVKSHRDLPLKLNQWCNVVRWEFKDAVPFLRTREFLWQEGHSAFETKEQSDVEVREILDFYYETYQNLLAVPSIMGKKTEKEKFAGSEYTTTLECYIEGNGRAIQAATSHSLGQHFSKLFDIEFIDSQGKKKNAWQNSWGFTTRSIGVMIMTHSDNIGFVCPPRVAFKQIVIVPCGLGQKSPIQLKEKLFQTCESINQKLLDVGVRSLVDLRDDITSGKKFYHWEIRGVPVRIEIGPRDIETECVVCCVRYNGEKITIPISNISERILKLLEDIHTGMFEKASSVLNNNVKTIFDWKDFVPSLDNKSLCLIPHCLQNSCEENIKTNSTRQKLHPTLPSMGAKSLCIPFSSKYQFPLNAEQKCIKCDRLAEKFVLFGRSY